MKFAKYHALGNDYLIANPQEAGECLSPAIVRWLCDRHYGVGSDGVLLGPLTSTAGVFGLRLYNPDGGEFEKSGNGLRIFARYLWDCGQVAEEPFEVRTNGGDVRCRVHPGGRSVTVEMGQVRFNSREIPVLGPAREVLGEALNIAGAEFRISAATIGNPHCIVLCDHLSREFTLQWGPLIETHPLFPNRANVQFMQVLDRSSIQIEIWERGAGYTLASGTSSCAAAAAAHRLGLCGREIAVHMPGGQLHVSLSADLSAILRGSVTKICEGVAFAEEAFA